MTNSLVPPAGPQRVLALAQLTNAVGDGAYLVTSAFYFTHVVGLSPARVGLGLTAGWAVGSVAGVPLGRLADRRGARGTAVLLASAAGLAVASFLFVRGFLPFVAIACAYAASQSGLAAARQTLLAGLVPAGERTGALAYLQSAFNAGLAVGAGLGGLAIQAGTREAYLAVFAMDAVTFVACAGVLGRLASVAPVPVRKRHGLGVVRDRRYVAVTALNTVLLLRMPLLSLGLPLWISERTQAPTWLVSALFVLNTGAVMVFQVRMARGVTGSGRPRARCGGRGGSCSRRARCSRCRPVRRRGSPPGCWWPERSSRSSRRWDSRPAHGSCPSIWPRPTGWVSTRGSSERG
ncbi:MFS transporter [Streptomyces sp. WM6386]|uniref:MFS transporter n=1 Tax=Streptomyces sp. WM6386 TaxID=1415558 RepID=UPI000A8B9C22